MSHNESILQHLQSGQSLTALEALNKFGCFRLASRINDLKKHNIKTEMITVGGKRFARYSIITKIEENGQFIIA